MAKIKKDDLSFMGLDYEFRLVSQILIDNKFANSIIDIVDPNYFTDPYLKLIVAAIKEAKEVDDIIPDIGSVRIRLLENVSEETVRKYIIKQLEHVAQASNYDSLKVQEIAMNFCKQQELKKSIKKIQKIIDSGEDNEYEQCEAILRKALEHGDNKDDSMNIFDNIKDVLKSDFRKPIRTGISGLDAVMDGGLSKGELAVVLAPYGVGKTTMLTKIANTAMNDGYKVLQIFFEDMPKVIQRKHLSCWSGIDLNELSLHEEEIMRMCAEKEKESKGILKLKKFSSDGTTMPYIRKYIRKKIAEGFKPDLILLDYIDVVEPSTKFNDSYSGEGSVMRQFESMLAEFDMAGWTAVQGNRSSIKANVVEADQMGGSIKKGQIGHFIVSIAKTLDQRDNGTATMAILKSRFGKDGIIFEDIIFDNARIQIDMETTKTGKTRVEYNKDIEKQGAIRVAEVFAANKLRKELLENG
jgi:replicative DNA helicase